jgi:hypothetical protein
MPDANRRAAGSRVLDKSYPAVESRQAHPSAIRRAEFAREIAFATELAFGCARCNERRRMRLEIGSEVHVRTRAVQAWSCAWKNVPFNSNDTPCALRREW